MLQRIWNLAFGPRDGDALPKEQAATTEQIAIEVAKAWTTQKELPWLQPVAADFVYTREGPVWWIRTDLVERGFSVRVVVDDGTGSVRGTTVLPR